VTHFSDKTELFVEFSPLVKGQPSAFAAHLTVTDPKGFQAVSDGKLAVVLSGNGLPEERVEAAVSDMPGIFRPVLTPQHEGKRQLALILEFSGGSVTHDLGEVQVYPDQKAADSVMSHAEEDAAAIGFTKEQQWKIPFATEPVGQRTVRESVAATATLRAGTDREAIIAAPANGLLRAGPAGFPRVGTSVKAGQVVAYLAPQLGGGADVATLNLDIERARIAAEQTRIDRERLEGLYRLEAIPAKRLQEAASRESLANAELAAARQRLATFGGGAGGIALKSPVSGEIVAVGVIPGGAVAEGQVLAHVADVKRLWLEARIAENDIARMAQPSGAFFEIGESGSAITLEVGKNAKLVAFGSMVDPVTRTVPVIFEFDNPGMALRAGMNLTAGIHTGRNVQGLAVPSRAIVDDGGNAVVYILREGESFERRVVTLGPRDGEHVAVTSGINEGERVVTLGAYQIRLAATAPAAIGHGHAH
jgi:RND family efflux transporter MFP subunit